MSCTKLVIIALAVLCVSAHDYTSVIGSNSPFNRTVTYDDDYVATFRSFFKDLVEEAKNVTISQREPLLDVSYFEFMPKLTSRLFNGVSTPIEDPDMTFVFTAVLDEADRSVTITYRVDPKSLFASSEYMFFLSERFIPHLFVFKGEYKIVLRRLTDGEIADFKTSGVRLFYCKDGIVKSLWSLSHTINLFLPFFSNKLMFISEDENLKFIKDVAGYTLEERPITEVPITVEDIHSGDVFASLKLDGIDPMISAITGARIGHIQIALEVDGEMKICEAQDAPYWPNHGWQCNSFDDFIQWTKDALYNTVHLRLKSPYRENFNATKAWEYLKPRIGTVYGYEIFFFTAIDTINDNFFDPLDEGSVEILYFFIDMIAKDFANLVLGRGLSIRLGLPSFPETPRADLLRIIAERGKKIAEVYTLPELDSNRYGEDSHTSRVCSTFGVEILRASGAFKNTKFDVDMNAAEQTPADIVAFDLWDTSSPLPAKCDQTLPYCQIWGDYRIDLANTINYKIPHPNMNEQCPSKAPSFERPAVC